MDVDEHCYAPLDRLLVRQSAIQQTLAKTHLHNDCIVLYYIASTYFEGEYEESAVLQFGYNRDGRRGHEPIVIGLLTNAEGCPIAVEVFPGNTQDASTVEGKIKELREKYGVSEIVLVGDRGMITASNEEKLAALPEALSSKTIQTKYRSLTFAGVLKTLKSQRRNQVSVGEAVFEQITEPTAEIRSILELLAVAPSHTP